MKLTTTLRNIKQFKTYESGIKRLLAAYPNLSEHEEISLHDILTDERIAVTDVIWALRATLQDSRSVSVEFARRCADRVKTYSVDDADDEHSAIYAANTAFDAAHTASRAAASATAYAAARAASRAADYAVVHASDCATADRAVHAARAAREHQKQDLIELLKV